MKEGLEALVEEIREKFEHYGESLNFKLHVNVGNEKVFLTIQAGEEVDYVTELISVFNNIGWFLTLYLLRCWLDRTEPRKLHNYRF